MINRPLYINKIIPYIDTPFIKIITGIRRCGKSTILKMLMQELLNKGIPKEQILNYRFDSMEYDGYTAAELFQLIKKQPATAGKNLPISR